MATFLTVEVQAEGVTRRIEEDPDVFLGLKLRELGPSSSACATAAERSSTSKSRCIVICCAPSTAGQAGRT